MVIYAILARTLFKPRLIPWNLDAGLILGAIGALMLSHFGLHAYEIAGSGHDARWPVSNQLAQLLPAEHAERGATIGYWLHVLVLPTFLNYLPYSKHIHLLGALPNIFTRNRSNRTMDLPKLDLEDEKQWGVGQYEQFSWKSLLDTYACTECARCTNYCPVQHRQEPVADAAHPRHPLRDARSLELRDKIAAAERDVANLEQYAKEHDQDDAHPSPDLVYARNQVTALKAELEGMPKLTGGRVRMRRCGRAPRAARARKRPVFIEHPLKILQMRQNLVLEQERTPSELQRTYRNIERQSNVGHRQRSADGVGEGSERPDDRRGARPRIHPVGRLRRASTTASSSRRARW